MADDLSAFFAKKKGKKKHVVNLQEVEQVLEGRTKRQEEYDREVEEVKRNYEESANGAEESEWIEYDSSNQGRLEGLKIKDMGVETEPVDEQMENEENKELRAEHVRTWGNLGEQKPDAPHSSEQTVSDAQMASAYKPPHQRTTKYIPPSVRKESAQMLDVNSDMLFPSLAHASKIEKTKKEETKAAGGWVKAGAPAAENREADKKPTPWRPANTEKDRTSAINAVRTLTAQNSNPTAAPPAAREVEPEKPKEENKYVPPHLRK